MVKNTLTFELGGRVDLKDFAEGIDAFRRLVVALTPRNSGVTWIVEDLQAESAVATFRGEADNPSKVERVINDYENIGAALAQHEDLPESNRQVTRAADAIKTLTNTIEYVRFETPDGDYTIYRNGHAPTVSIGAVTGRVQTLSNRGGLRFNLYDTFHDKAVACYLAPGQEELMREAWGQRARVSGRVSREASTGRPTTICSIMNVEILEDVPPGSYRLARGAVPRRPGDMLAEDAIRRLRDAWQQLIRTAAAGPWPLVAASEVGRPAACLAAKL